MRPCFLKILQYILSEELAGRVTSFLNKMTFLKRRNTWEEYTYTGQCMYRYNEPLITDPRQQR